MMSKLVRLLMLLGLAGPALSFAQAYPAKPIRIILPIAAGSVTDVSVRAAAQELAPRFGQPLVVENRPGAAMIVGAEACSKGVPDGYTVCVVSPDAMSFNPHLFSTLSYDPEKDFAPVGSLFVVIEGLIGSSSLTANSVRELQALTVSKRGAINFGTLGPGTTPDIFRQWLSSQWKTEIAGIPYKGGGLVITALLADEIHVSKIGVGNIGPGMLTSGKLKILAVAATRRSGQLPNVPTMAEVGLDGFKMRVWWGLVAPARTPEAVVGRVNAEFNRLIGEPKFAEFLDSRFLEPFTGTPQAFAAFLKQDRDYVGQLVKQYNVPRQ